MAQESGISPSHSDQDSQPKSSIKISEFIAQSAGDPTRLIDGRWMLRDEVVGDMRKAILEAEMVIKSFEAENDAGMLHHLRRFAAFGRHAASCGGALMDANRAAAEIMKRIRS